MEQGAFPQHHQQGMTPWYPGHPPPPYQQQVAAHPQQQQHHHHPLPWSSAPPPSMPPTGDPSFNYAAYHHPPHGDYYSQQQVHHQYPPPAQPQFTYMYNQQDQLWQGNNNWNCQQWSYPAQSGDLSKEEVWAAKARAWAASKAVQDESRTMQQGPTATPPQPYQDYSHQQRETNLLESQQPTQPPSQDGSGLSYYQSAAGQVQSVSSRPISEAAMQKPTFEKHVQDTSPSVISDPNFDNDHKAAVGGGTPQSNDIQSVFNSSHMHDASESYRLDNGLAGPTGGERHDPLSQVPYQHPAAPLYNQPTTHLLPQSQASPLVSQPRFNYNDKPIHSVYEPHPHPQPLTANYHQPPIPQQTQQLPLQPQYPSSGVTEVREGDFGLSPSPMQNWPPVGGPGMPFPPAGAPQFDHLHPPHHMSVPMYGRPDAPQGLGFPNSGPFVAGLNPALAPPGPGAPVRPFAPENFVEKPKKAAVPSWLREELIKKKAAALAGNNTGMQLSDEISRVNGEESIHLSQRLGLSSKLASGSPGLSDDDEEDQEEEIEAARNAAINLEIKRLLTEVLLKVTGDLFEEIAQEVLDEEDQDGPKGRITQTKHSGNTSVTSVATTTAPSGRVLLSSVKVHVTDGSGEENDSSSSEVPATDLLGLGSYASDDESPDSNDNQGGGKKSTEQNHSHVDTEEQKATKEVIPANDNPKDIDNAEHEKIVDGTEHLNRQSDAINETSRKHWREHDMAKPENGEFHGTARSEIKESRHTPSLRPETEIGYLKDQKDAKIRDLSGKEKEENTKEKDAKFQKSLDLKSREHSSRDDKMDRVKEKTKPREKDHDRDRRKHDKKETRSKKIDSVERRHRRHSPSSSSEGAEGSPSSSSDNSRGRSHVRRSSKHQTTVSSPGRSRKSSRRVSRSRSRSPHLKHSRRSHSRSHSPHAKHSHRSRSRSHSPRSKHSHRSRSRSRSPHGKHSHRKNLTSPSREKSRRNPSPSPVAKRRRS